MPRKKAEPVVADSSSEWSRNESTMQPPVTAAAPPAGVKVMLMCKSVFLPADPTRADWPEAPTKKYQGETNDRRTRLVVHPDLAAFLQERKQAETLD